MNKNNTHVLAPATMVLRLRLMSDATRVSQADYLREAMADLRRAHESGTPPPAAPRDGSHPVSLVFRLSTSQWNWLQELATRTRVRQSEHIRDAIQALLVKRGWADYPLPAVEPVAETPPTPVVVLPPHAPPVCEPAPVVLPHVSPPVPRREGALVNGPRCARTSCGLRLSWAGVDRALGDGDWRCDECRPGASLEIAS